MTFDPFAPVPENSKPKEHNVYDDILNPDAQSAARKPFDPDFAAPPTTAPARPAQPSARPTVQQPTAQSPSSPAPVAPVEETRRARAAADRQRSVAERGSAPALRELVVTRQRKFPLLVVALVVSILVILGGIGFGIFYAVTNKSEVVTEDSKAMTTTGIPGLPDGFTGQQILDAPRVEEAETALTKQADGFIGQVDFITFEKTDGLSTSMQDANGKDTLVFLASSSLYTSNTALSREQKEALIESVNGYLVEQGYSPYDINSSGLEYPFEAPQLFIGGVRTTADGSLESYSIVINTDVADSAVPSGVYVTFYSSPHIKSGTEGEFTKFVTDSYNASR